MDSYLLKPEGTIMTI